jgi:hypothetical protein
MGQRKNNLSGGGNISFWQHIFLNGVSLCKSLFMKVCYVLSTAMVLLMACNKDHNSSDATVSVYLTDDPSPYDKVLIDVQSVEINNGTGWRPLRMIRPGVYNLLNFRNGRDTILATERLAKGRISQIRLILGANNSVVVNGIELPLKTPSAQESGLKLNVDAQLTAGIEYKMWLDFDAARSVVAMGNGGHILKPVIRVYTKAVSGSIKGTVLPAAADAWVYALNDNDTLASAKPDSVDGNFLIPGLTQGTYSVAIDGSNGYNDTTYPNLNVTTGFVTDIGSVQLHQ